MDPSLVERDYDVIIVGTGMVEALLAGAFARVGKNVLHLDQNDYYGTNYATYQFSSFLKWTLNEPIEARHFCDTQDKKQEKVNPHEFIFHPTYKRYAFSNCKNLNACHLLSQSFQSKEWEETLILKSNSFSIDKLPRLVLSSEDLVQILITSGVGRYLEFQAIERTCMFYKNDIYEVPCSKKDVFSSKLLNMMEKRQLMKFLQVVADYGETYIKGEDATTKNERSLVLGRALQRPQNKKLSEQVEQLIELNDTPFQHVLEHTFRLSSKVQQVVLYCVALCSFPSEKDDRKVQLTTQEGLEKVFRYVSSIGQYAHTAFLLPLYGASELPQSFCRLCAVYGGVYVLRAPIEEVVLGPVDKSKELAEEKQEAEEDSEQSIALGVSTVDNKLLKTKICILNGIYQDIFETKSKEVNYDRILRCVVVLSTSLRPDKSRLMLVIPPRDSTLENPNAIQCIQLDSDSYVCPKGMFLLHLSMALPSEWKGDEEKQNELMEKAVQLLVESAQREQQYERSTTTEIHQGVKTEDLVHDNSNLQNVQAEENHDNVGNPNVHQDTEINPNGPLPQDIKDTNNIQEGELSQNTEESQVSELNQIVEDQLHQSAEDTSIGQKTDGTTINDQPTWLDWVLWRCVFSIADITSRDNGENNTVDKSTSINRNIPSNVYICETSNNSNNEVSKQKQLEIDFELASANAREIFSKICPNEDFLPKSASAEQAEKEEAEEEDDAVLQAAVGLAQQVDQIAEKTIAEESQSEHSHSDIINTEGSQDIDLEPVVHKDIRESNDEANAQQ